MAMHHRGRAAGRLPDVFAVSGMIRHCQQRPDLGEMRCAAHGWDGGEASRRSASITGIYVINGKPGFSAQRVAQAIKRHPHYDDRVLEKTAKGCTLRFLHAGEILGEESFTSEMAQRASLTSGPWKAYPEAMLFARLPDGWHDGRTAQMHWAGTRHTRRRNVGAPGQIDESGMAWMQSPSPLPGWSQSPKAASGMSVMG
jgi:hypothetical protein